MHETGATIEELASVIVSLRKWAALNPNALLRRELTIDEVLRAKVVAHPATSRMCNIVVDGASAIIMTSAENAKKWTDAPVYLEGLGSAVTHFSLMNEPDLTRMAYRKTAEQRTSILWNSTTPIRSSCFCNSRKWDSANGENPGIS